MLMDTWQIIVAILGAMGVGGILQVLINGWLNRRKTKAEAYSTESDVPGKIVDAAGNLATQALIMVKEQVAQLAIMKVEQAIQLTLREGTIADMAALKQENKDLRTEIGHVKEDLRLLHRELAEFRRGYRILVQQMKEHSIIPAWVPAKRRAEEAVASDTTLDP